MLRHALLPPRILARRRCLAPLAGFAEPEYDVPFVPTPPALVEKMLDLAQVTATDYLIDLGCGDGRIAVAAARRGARALGVDLDPLRIQEAAAAARIAEIESRVVFRRQDLFRTPIYEASVIALYLLPEHQSAAAPAPADRAAPRQPGRQPRLRHGRMARRGAGGARRPPHLPLDRARGRRRRAGR